MPLTKENIIKNTPEDEIRQLVREELAAVTLFEFVYRPRHKVQSDLVQGTDLKSVKEACLRFCQRHEVHYVYVRPACLNLNAGMRDNKGFQKVEQEKISS
jgi:hypothetical protein